MIPTVAVIPTRFEPERLYALLDIVSHDVDDMIVLDNGHEPPLAPGKLHNGDLVDVRGMGLYSIWNLGWRTALEYGNPVNVCILNDDIRILPGTLSMMATALRREPRLGCVYPDRHVPLAAGLPAKIRTTSLFDPVGSREMTGFCFMFKGELPLPPFDEGYEWWYADSVFDEAVKAAGYGVGQVDGLPIEHVSDAETNDWARRPELKEAIARDGVRWARLHDRIEDGRWVPA